MDRADKAVLRLAIGLGLAVLIAYGLALPAPFVVCVLTVLLLCKPGPPIPFLKGAVMAVVIAALLVAGVLMVPILENYAVTGVVLTGALLYAVFFAGARSANPLTIFLVIAFTLDSCGRCGRSGPEHRAQRGRWGGARHRDSGQWRLTRFFSGCSRASQHCSGARRQSGNGRLGRPAGYSGGHARVRACPDKPVFLFAGNHENSGTRPTGWFHQCPLGRTGVGGLHLDGGHGWLRWSGSACPYGQTCGC